MGAVNEPPELRLPAAAAELWAMVREVVRCANIGVFIWDWHGLGRYDFRAAAFVEDAHGRGYIYVQVAVDPGTADDGAARGVDLGLKDITRHLEQAGIRLCTPHDLRRTFITTLLDEGNDVAVASRMAGHRNIATTTRYDRRDERTNRDRGSDDPHSVPGTTGRRDPADAVRAGRTAQEHRGQSPGKQTRHVFELANTDPGRILLRGHRSSITFTLSTERPERPATSPVYPRTAAGGAG